MVEFYTSGTLGDSYIISCKLKLIKDQIKIFHHTKHTGWYNEINNIFSLLNNVEVEFVDKPKFGLKDITSDCHLDNIDFFPEFFTKRSKNDFLVLQTHSGKDSGFNHKELSKEFLQKTIDSSKIPVILVGTLDKFSDVKGCCNLCGLLSVTSVMNITANATNFIGPEGLLSFVALSHKVPSVVYYTEEDAVNKRIRNTPWEEFVDLRKIR